MSNFYLIRGLTKKSEIEIKICLLLNLDQNLRLKISYQMATQLWIYLHKIIVANPNRQMLVLTLNEVVKKFN